MDAALNDQLSPFNDGYYMQLALQEAQKAYEKQEIPVGALIVCNNRIIAKGYNQVESLQDATAHAEMLALSAAFNYLGAKYLRDCTLYVTLEPCMMCASASYWAKIDRLVFGAVDKKMGYTNFQPKVLHPKTKVCQGILAEQSQQIIEKFFVGLRK